MSEEELYDHAYLIVGAGVLGNKERCIEALKKAIDDAVQAERDRCCALVKYRWTFDGDQQHTHNWHAMADTVHDIISGTPAPKEVLRPRPGEAKKK